ncbi:MAG: thioredoxin-disulfide reductase [Deltaproteobacteria bacterium]|nr:thioredoxin-disulfide reductase [Deltaproteobacteria bacterium]
MGQSASSPAPLPFPPKDAVRDVIIVGSGPAGYTAALYCARANLQPLMFEGDIPHIPGGQLMITTEVENYPGFPDGVAGPDLMEKLKAQAARFGTELVQKSVSRIDFSKRPFRVEADDEVRFGKAIIVATGATARWLGVDNEDEARNRGASACATCDGALFRGRELVVVGGGDTAMEEATFLTRFATKVTLVHRRDSLRASKVMADRAAKNPKIAFKWNSVVEKYLFDDKKYVNGVVLKDVKTGKTENFPCGGVFVAIGHKPNTELFHGVLDTDENGYLKTKGGPKGATMTNVTGVFACGDVQDSYYRQAVTAAGSGCQAAIDVERWLEAVGH